MINDAELRFKIAITQIPGIGPVNGKVLMAYCGSAQAVLTATKKELMQIPGVGETTTKSVLDHSAAALARADCELDFIDKNNVQVLFYADKNYPARLKQYNDCPFLLYFKGSVSLDHARTVGVVGTRKITPYGEMMCDQIVTDLLKYDVQVISGLAYGVDVAAHKRCLDIGIPTIGIMGNGLGRVYPHAHKRTAERMIENGGLLTEHLQDIGPEREHFPMRNRLIAALSDALVVVETAESGGSIITAELANTYNKDVFAVPGRLNDPFSKGCNKLIKTNKAALIESAADISYIMRWDEMDNKQRNVQAQLFVELTEDEQLMVDTLRGSTDMQIDAITTKTGFSPSKTASLLLTLEFQGLVKAMPGKRYMLR